ncbi:MAG: cytochrome b N-terminal domain-containing protein, partial [Bacteroidales bacterium]|nr:cytochrome b N-terminal domain-containing protein [Bacteroidales bacterium]
VVMFVVVLIMGFSGYLLPWDQLSYWAVIIGSNIAASARELTDLLGITSFFDVGGFLKRILIGGEDVGQAALTRFFMLHVIFLPLSLLVLTAVHLWRIRKDGGLNRPVEDESSGKADEKKWYSWPLVFWIELAILLGVITLLLALSFFIEAPLLEQANPAHPENPAKSPWYFLGIQELVSYSAFAGGLFVPLIFLIFLFSIPYKDREDRFAGKWFSSGKGVKIAFYSGLLSIGVVISQVFVHVRFGWLRDWFPGISQWFVMFINPATLTVLIFIIYAIVIRRRTNSTRLSAIALFTVSIVALIIFTVIGIWFRQANWEFVL